MTGVDRRTFIAGASAALGAFAAVGGAASGAAFAAGGPGLRPAAREQVARLRRLASARRAERTFGPGRWAQAHSSPLGFGAAGSPDGDVALFVPLDARDGRPTLLVLSDATSAEHDALARAARRSGDAALFSDDVVVQLDRDGEEPTLRWLTADGRELAARRIGGGRLSLGPAARPLASGLGHSAFAFGVRLDAGGEGAGVEPLARAAASGSASVRRSATPIAELRAA